MAYFTVAEFRTRYPALTDPPYTDAKINEYRTLAEEAFEDAAGVAFEPRTDTVTRYVHSTEQALVLPPRLRSVSAASVDGTALTAGELTDLAVDNGVVYRSATSAGWKGAISVTYSHGYDAPPAWVKSAVMLLTKTWMLAGASPIDDRATQLATEDGTINLSTPGLFGATFGIPFVDAALAQYAVRTMVA